MQPSLARFVCLYLSALGTLTDFGFLREQHVLKDADGVDASRGAERLMSTRCCQPRVEPQRIQASGCGCAHGASGQVLSANDRAFQTVARLKSQFKDMPGIESIGVYTVGFSPYVIVKFVGASRWRAAQMGASLGHHPNNWEGNALWRRDTANNIDVALQPYLLNGGIESPNGRWADAVRADPNYQKSVRVLKGAKVLDASWRDAHAFLLADALVYAVYRQDPDYRADSPPREQARRCW